jgi:hypothetical protein
LTVSHAFPQVERSSKDTGGKKKSKPPADGKASAKP